MGYKNPSNAISVHVDKDDKTSYLIQVSGSNYKANTAIINESGLYSLILSSKLESAKVFKHWVTSEVLPTIRKTGGYIREESFLEKTVRVFGTPDEPLFLARDVAEWIDYSKRPDGTYKVSVMLNPLDDDEKVKITTPTTNKDGVLQSNTEYWFLTENGLYEVLMLSRKPKAKEFKKKVKEILKTIRKTGGRKYIFVQNILYPPVICSILILSRSEGGTDMKKNLKKTLVILLAVIMIFSLPLSASAATKKNVTKTYKKSVTRMLRGFDSYFGYCCGKNQYFKFDDYARTTMVLMRNYPSDNRLSTVKKKLRPQLKLYFNTSTVKFKKFTKYEFPRNPSYLFCNKNGRIVYNGGNWGEVAPKGFVKKIIRTSSNRFEVTYNVHFYNGYTRKTCGHMGTYKIYLKKANNKNGFVITNIKQTVSKKVWL